tara:strand:+ start:2115 stop:2237 length:123 start_codon:yes stop_codon:yes gene_type:complete
VKEEKGVMGKYLDKEDWVLIGKAFGACLVIIALLGIAVRC